MEKSNVHKKLKLKVKFEILLLSGIFLGCLSFVLGYRDCLEVVYFIYNEDLIKCILWDIYWAY